MEEAVLRTGFSGVGDVLNAMQEQDQDLVAIITEMNVRKRLGLGYDDSRFRKKVELLAPEILLGTLRETVTA